MKPTPSLALVCASVLFTDPRVGMTQPFRTHDAQVSVDTNVLEVVLSGGPESLPSNEDPEGHWGSTVEGFSLSVRFPTNLFVAGEPIVGYAFLRNTTDRRRDYIIDTSRRPGGGCDFVITDPLGKELVQRPNSIGFGSLRSHGVPPLTQDRHWARLDKTFDLSAPGEYKVRAKATVVTLDGKKTVEINSGPALVRVITRVGSTNGVAGPKPGPQP